MINVTRISSDELINQIADTLAEVDADFLCDIADKVLSAKHSAVGMTPDGYDLIEQKYEEPEEPEDLEEWFREQERLVNESTCRIFRRGASPGEAHPGW